jgi:ATP:ADP antiporter, AAA family
MLRAFMNRFARVEPREVATVLAAFFLFFFVLGSYFAVRPVRETVATIIGRDRVADLWILTGIFSFLIVPLYGWLVARVRRSILLPSIYAAVAVILAMIGTALAANERNLLVGQFFYVWISVLNLLLVSVFWSFLLEIFSTEQTKRLFGFVAAGGTIGAFIGPLATSQLVEHLGNGGVLYVGAAGFVGAILCQRILVGIWTRDGGAAGAAVESRARDRELGGNPFAGFALVFKSPYLLGIAAFVGFVSLVNTFLYFEQLRLAEAAFAGTTQRTEFFAYQDAVIQFLVALAQVFVTGRIATKFGVRFLLTVVPAVMIVAFLALASFNMLVIVTAAIIFRRWGEYAFVRPGREMLWSRLDTETKYKAKNVVDVPVYRVVDAVGAQAKSALEVMGLTASGVAVIGAFIAAGWAANGWWLGRRHDAGKS